MSLPTRKQDIAKAGKMGLFISILEMLDSFVLRRLIYCFNSLFVIGSIVNKILFDINSMGYMFVYYHAKSIST